MTQVTNKETFLQDFLDTPTVALYTPASGAVLIGIAQPRFEKTACGALADPPGNPRWKES